MEQFARKGVIIKRLYGMSRTGDGIRLARKLQFKQVTPPAEENDLLRFELDLETTTNPPFEEYQEIVKQAAIQTTKNERQQVSHAKNVEKPRCINSAIELLLCWSDRPVKPVEEVRAVGD
jgi:hypothetical protein